MAEESKRLKSIRKSKLAAFTRKKNSVVNLLEGTPSTDRLKEAILDVKSVFKTLEEAHEEYAASVEEEVIDNEGDFLESSHNMLDSLEMQVADKVKLLEDTDKYSKAKNQMEH